MNYDELNRLRDREVQIETNVLDEMFRPGGTSRMPAGEEQLRQLQQQNRCLFNEYGVEVPRNVAHEQLHPHAPQSEMDAKQFATLTWPPGEDVARSDRKNRTNLSYYKSAPPCPGEEPEPPRHA